MKLQKSKKTEARQIILSLAMVSLIVGAVLMNDSLVGQHASYLISDNSGGSSQIRELNRAIASAHPMNPFVQSDWEKKLSIKLALDDRTPASVSRQISAIDELRYGALANYRVEQSADITRTEAQTGIHEIEYVDPVDVLAKPVFLEPEKFLNQYGSLLSVTFDTYQPVQTSSKEGTKTSSQAASVKEYELIKDKKVVGIAQFQMDSDGKFLRLKVRTAGLQTP